MPPVLYLVRHAEGFHNTAWHGNDIHDPFLTEHGKEQCAELCKNFPHHDKIELLMASPMKRTIQTCQLSFKPAVDRGLKILLMSLAQEASTDFMDTGSGVDSIKEAYGDLVDTHRCEEVHPYWHRNVGLFAADPTQQIERARRLRNFIRDRPEKHVVLVSHGSFAHAITGNLSEEGEELTRMWENAECRSYTFDENSGDKALVVETEESIKGRPDLEFKKKDSPLQA